MTCRPFGNQRNSRLSSSSTMRARSSMRLLLGVLPLASSLFPSGKGSDCDATPADEAAATHRWRQQQSLLLALTPFVLGLGEVCARPRLALPSRRPR